MLDEDQVYFIVWNVFQLLHFKAILHEMPKANLVIEKRREHYVINDTHLVDIDNPIIFVDKTKIYETIGLTAKVIVVQTMFEQIYLFKHTKIVMLQYGYAKANHNYGLWRVLADLNLVYGNYAKQQITPLSPTQITGCPRYDIWHNEDFYTQCQQDYAKLIDKTKQTLLYAPSWGDASSVDDYIKEICQLSSGYNVFVKLHHLWFLQRDEVLDKAYKNVHFFYDDIDILSLLAVADVVLSDYSGAIFDAIYCQKPIVLLSLSEEKMGKCLEVVGKDSLEIVKRSDLGYIVSQPKELADTVKKALTLGKVCDDKLYYQLFSDTKTATNNVINAIENVISTKTSRNLQQLYYRQKIKRRLYKVAKKRAKKRKKS